MPVLALNSSPTEGKLIWHGFIFFTRMNPVSVDQFRLVYINVQIVGCFASPLLRIQEYKHVHGGIVATIK